MARQSAVNKILQLFITGGQMSFIQSPKDSSQTSVSRISNACDIRTWCLNVFAVICVLIGGASTFADTSTSSAEPVALNPQHPLQLNLVLDPVIISSSLWGTILSETLDSDKDVYRGGEVLTLIHQRLSEEGFNVVLQPGRERSNAENEGHHELIMIPEDLDVSISTALLLFATKTDVTIIVEDNTVVLGIQNPDAIITRAPADHRQHSVNP